MIIKEVELCEFYKIVEEARFSYLKYILYWINLDKIVFFKPEFIELRRVVVDLTIFSYINSVRKNSTSFENMPCWSDSYIYIYIVYNKKIKSSKAPIFLSNIFHQILALLKYFYLCKILTHLPSQFFSLLKLWTYLIGWTLAEYMTNMWTGYYLQCATTHPGLEG